MFILKRPPQLAASFISFQYYKPAIRDAFGNRVAYGQINKTYGVTHLAVTEASRRYSPAGVVKVERAAVNGVPAEISTSYVERSHLTLRQSSKRFGRLTNGFSKKLEPHCAAVSLHVAHYNLCRTHEALRTTPAVALGIADHVWTIDELIHAALTAAPTKPTPTPARRRRAFRGNPRGFIRLAGVQSRLQMTTPAHERLGLLHARTLGLRRQTCLAGLPLPSP